VSTTLAQLESEQQQTPMTLTVSETRETKANSGVRHSESLPVQTLECHETTIGSMGWTEQEDRRLIELHRKYGNRWALIKKFMGGKTGQQCLKRWRYTLDPAVRKDSWTKEETEKLLKLQKELGSKWSDIARKLGTGRTDIQCRYRFFRVISGKAANTVSRETSRLYKSASLWDSKTYEEEVSGRQPNRPVEMQRRSSDPGSEAVVISSMQPEIRRYRTNSEASLSFSSRFCDGTRNPCTQHSPNSFIYQEHAGTHHRVVESDSSPTVCPDCGIARVRPSHSFSSSRGIFDTNYISPSASPFSKQERWAALDSMMGITSGSFSQDDSLRTFQSQVLPVFGDRNVSKEASYDSLMGIPSTVSGASVPHLSLKGDSYHILPPLHMDRMKTVPAIEDPAMKDNWNLPPLRE